MSTDRAFGKLRELLELTNQVSVVEKKWETTHKRSKERGEKNILQCPKDSLSAMQHLRMDVKNISKDSLKTLSTLQLLSHKSQKMLNAADKILNFLDGETNKTEEFLQKFGYSPLQDASKRRPGQNSVSDGTSHEEEILNNEVLSSKTEPNAENFSKNESEVDPVDGKSKEETEENHRYFALPKSPEAPLFSSNFKRDSLHSPEAPSVVAEQPLAEPYFPEHSDNFREPAPEEVNARMQKRFDELPQSPSLPNTFDKKLEGAQNIPSTRFFDTPRIDEYKSDDQFRNLPTNAPFFNKLTESPESPQTARVDADMASPDLTLFSRRSILLNVPERESTIDDDTVYHLKGGRQMSQYMLTPQSPELTDFNGFPKMEALGSSNKLPDTPPSPELTSHTNFSIKKENVDPESLSEKSVYQIKESQYQTLPDYLKRIIPYKVASVCLEKVLESSFALPGKYARVTTEAKISEVTNLVGKTKSFVLLMQSLKIVQRIRGTEYFEFII